MSRQMVFRKLRSAGIRLRQTLISQRFGFAPSSIYDAAFYDGPGCAQGQVHAEAVAKILVTRFRPRTLFDFGCGQGALIGAASVLGVEAAGCEGSVHGVRRCPSNCLVFQADLKNPIHINRTFDLVTCIEVAEHLPKRNENVLVASIASVAEARVMFSASGPGQPGDDHINLMPPEHWAGLFRKHGFRENTATTLEIRDAMRDADVPHWFQNTIVLER